MRTTAIYVRVSSLGQNVAGQRREIERWLAGNGITDAEWFIDKATGNTTCVWEAPSITAMKKLFNSAGVENAGITKVEDVTVKG